MEPTIGHFTLDLNYGWLGYRKKLATEENKRKRLGKEVTPTRIKYKKLIR